MKREKVSIADANAFVKSQQMKQKKYFGKEPGNMPEDMKFNQVMVNTGEHATLFAKMLTKGIDEDAFPVR